MQQELRITPEDAQDRTFWKSRIRAADPHQEGKGEEEDYLYYYIMPPPDQLKMALGHVYTRTYIYIKRRTNQEINV